MVASSNRIGVAVGVVCRRQEVLITQRQGHQHQGGLWEFPGGKIHPDETPGQALTRELLEEVNLRITHCKPFMQIPYDYPDKSVLLHVFFVEKYAGIVQGLEGQAYCWVPRQQLDSYEFPAANQLIIQCLRS